MSVAASYTFFIDFNNDGDYGEADENITTDVISASWSRGFSGPYPEQCQAGSLNLKVRNPTGKYSYENEQSSIFGESTLSRLHPGLRIQVKMDGVIQFTGYVETITTSIPETLESGEAEITAYGPIAQFTSPGDVNIAFQENIYTGDAIKQLLMAEGISVDDVDLIEQGQTRISKWWIRNGQSRLSSIQEIQNTELMGRFFESKSGKLVFHDSWHHWSGPTSPSPARSTYGDGTLRMWDPKADNPWVGIYNKVTAGVRTFNLTEDITLVTLTDAENGLGGQPLRLLPGLNTFWLELNDKTNTSNIIAVYNWSTSFEVPMLDLQLSETPDGTVNAELVDNVTIVKTPYGNRLKVDITNNLTYTIYAIVMRGRGTGLTEGDPTELKNEIADSILRFRKSEYPSVSNWLTDCADTQDYIDYILDEYAYPRTRISFSIIANVDSAHLSEVSLLDINDKIHITDEGTFGLYVDADFIIDSITHNVVPEMPGGFHTVNITCTRAPLTRPPAMGTTITPIITGPNGPPDDLYINGIDPSGTIVMGLVARKFNADVYLGEIRAKYYATETPDYVDMRTVAEGGTFADNGTTQLIFADRFASPDHGFNIQFISPYSTGRWYYSGRIKNKSFGWSLWTDGNSRPVRVTDWVDVESGASADNGPPENAQEVKTTMTGSNVTVTCNRPGRNANTILFAGAVLRNGNVGAWYDLDHEDSNSPAEVYYDGSEIDHIFNKKTSEIISPEATAGWSTLTKGLILFDVYNGTTTPEFNIDNCQWGWFFNNGEPWGNKPLTGCQFRPAVDADGDEDYIWEHVRIKIVKPYWEWDTHGYLGACGVTGLDFTINSQQGDKSTKIFSFPIMVIPDEYVGANIVAQVFFENKICRAVCGNSGGLSDDSLEVPPIGDHDLEIITHDVDATVPKGMFALKWYRTTNYVAVYAATFWASSSLPAQGPFDEERAAHTGATLETGTCTVTQGSWNITVAGRSTTGKSSKVLLLILESDVIDGDYIKTDSGGTTITMGAGWGSKHDGSYTYVIIEPWYAAGFTSNLAYYQFKVPDEIGGNAESEVWQTTTYYPIPSSGTWYISGCTRNPYGLGAYMHASSLDIGTGGGAFCVRLADNATINTDAKLAGQYNEKLFIVSVDGNRTLANPSNSVCGQVIKWRITNTSGSDIVITLGDKFRRGQAFPTYAQDSNVGGDLYIVEDDGV